MFLKEVQTRPAGGITRVALRQIEASGETVPEILHLFRFKPGVTNHLVRFTEEVMRGPSPLSEGLRELIGAYFSKHNSCSFCSDAHAAAAAEYLEKGLVDEVLRDVETSRLDSAHKELFRYIGKLARTPERVTESDILKLKSAGWTEEAIYDALTVASVFRFYNTWNNGSGVQKMASTDYAYSGQVLKTMGYCMDFKLGRLIRLLCTRMSSVLRLVLGRNRRSRVEQAEPWTESTSARQPSA